MTAPAPTEFKAVLDPNDLSNIPRDLSFHPVQNPSPRMLTVEQVAQFNRDGYIKGIRVYEADDQFRSFEIWPGLGHSHECQNCRLHA